MSNTFYYRLYARLSSAGSRLLTHCPPENRKTQVDTMRRYESLLALRKFSQTAITRL